MFKKITPVFILGAARNGTTNLENTIASLPQIAGAEHWLHYGSHESNIYQNKKYWGNLSKVDDYISFLYQYATYDYFQLCEGDINYHLNHKQADFYSFFFDLMDNYCYQKRKHFWVTKLDPQFLLDVQELNNFFNLLSNRYENIRFIRIKRDFKASFKSYLKMEGENSYRRTKAINLWPALLLQASRYNLTYSKEPRLDHRNLMDITFESYIKDRKNYILKIGDFLGIKNIDIDSLDIDRFQVNTSFVKPNKKQPPKRILNLCASVQSILERYPGIARFIWSIYEGKKKKPVPDGRRLIKYHFYEDSLMRELKKKQAEGLIELINNNQSKRENCK